VTDPASAPTAAVASSDLSARPGKYRPFRQLRADVVAAPGRGLFRSGPSHPSSSNVVPPGQAAGQPFAAVVTAHVLTFFFFFPQFGPQRPAGAVAADTPYETLTRGYRLALASRRRSQMLRNFVWNRRSSSRIASNVATGERFPTR